VSLFFFRFCFCGLCFSNFDCVFLLVFSILFCPVFSATQLVRFFLDLDGRSFSFGAEIFFPIGISVREIFRTKKKEKNSVIFLEDDRVSF